MALWSFINKLLKKRPFNPGANLDPRPETEKQLDYRIDEIVSEAAPVSWIETLPFEIRVFPIQNQNGSGSCVAQSRRKLYRILFKVNRGQDLDFSASYIYRLRANYSEPGMNANDAISLTRHRGITLNGLMPSDYMSDAQMNAVKIEPHHDEIAKEFAVPNEVTFASGDIETVASTIQKTRKGVMTWFYFTEREWAREVPQMVDNLNSPSDARALRHSVVAIESAIYRHGGGVSKDFGLRIPLTSVGSIADSSPKNFIDKETSGLHIRSISNLNRREC